MLRGCAFYARSERFPICTGAIFGVGIGRAVFSLSAARLFDLAGKPRLTLADPLSHGPGGSVNLRRGSHRPFSINLPTATSGSALQARHHARNSVMSTRRFAVSQL
jgi:hypothetical protein